MNNSEKKNLNTCLCMPFLLTNWFATSAKSKVLESLAKFSNILD